MKKIMKNIFAIKFSLLTISLTTGVEAQTMKDLTNDQLIEIIKAGPPLSPEFLKSAHEKSREEAQKTPSGAIDFDSYRSIMRFKIESRVKEFGGDEKALLRSDQYQAALKFVDISKFDKSSEIIETLKRAAGPHQIPEAATSIFWNERDASHLKVREMIVSPMKAVGPNVQYNEVALNKLLNPTTDFVYHDGKGNLAQGIRGVHLLRLGGEVVDEILQKSMSTNLYNVDVFTGQLDLIQKYWRHFRAPLKSEKAIFDLALKHADKWREEKRDSKRMTPTMGRKESYDRLDKLMDWYVRQYLMLRDPKEKKPGQDTGFHDLMKKLEVSEENLPAPSFPLKKVGSTDFRPGIPSTQAGSNAEASSEALANMNSGKSVSTFYSPAL